MELCCHLQLLFAAHLQPWQLRGDGAWLLNRSEREEMRRLRSGLCKERSILMTKLASDARNINTQVLAVFPLSTALASQHLLPKDH